MNRDKQIENMTKDLCDIDCKGMKCNVCDSYGCEYRMQAEALYNAGYRKASEVAREIFGEIEKQLARYSHLHRYAEEAYQVTDEYADGTPCEMTSVWDVISLHKNGWDDYETMHKLEDNIRTIANSSLLKEFEGDIAELKKKYTEEK